VSTFVVARAFLPVLVFFPAARAFLLVAAPIRKPTQARMPVLQRQLAVVQHLFQFELSLDGQPAQSCGKHYFLIVRTQSQKFPRKAE
jgi:hypothetical protein